MEIIRHAIVHPSYNDGQCAGQRQARSTLIFSKLCLLHLTHDFQFVLVRALDINLFSKTQLHQYAIRKSASTSDTSMTLQTVSGPGPLRTNTHIDHFRTQDPRMEIHPKCILSRAVYDKFDSLPLIPRWQDRGTSSRCKVHLVPALCCGDRRPFPVLN